MQDSDQTTDQNNTSNDPQNSTPVGYTHVGSLQKEQGFGFSQGEMIKPTEQGPQISKELKDAGVEKAQGLLKIEEEHEKIGIKLAKEATPVSTSPSGVSLPQTSQGIKNLLKSKNPAQSFFWFLTLFLKQLKKGGRN